jgi:hypothetical protein
MAARELLLEAAREVQAGSSPRGTQAEECREVSAADVVIPAGVEWREFMKDDFIASW